MARKKNIRGAITLAKGVVTLLKEGLYRVTIEMDGDMVEPSFRGHCAADALAVGILKCLKHDS